MRRSGGLYECCEAIAGQWRVPSESFPRISQPEPDLHSRTSQPKLHTNLGKTIKALSLPQGYRPRYLDIS